MSREVKFWGRDGHVDIEGVNIPEGLDFKFEVKYTGDIATEFTCGILGLGMETIRKITVWNDAMAYSQTRGIEIFAGYKDIVGPKKLISGYIINALPTNPPEMWLNIKGAMDASLRRVITKPYVLGRAKGEHYTAKQILYQIAWTMGLKYRWEVEDKRLNSGDTWFEFSGMLSELPRKFANRYDILCYVDQGTLIATDKNGQFIKKADANGQIIDVEHGLIGISGLDMNGAKIKMRLNDSFRMNTWVELRSQIVPSANGLYFVKEKRHVGHLRGDEWYTELDTFRRQR